MLQVKGAGNVAQALSALVDASSLCSADGTKLAAWVQSRQQGGDEKADSGFGAPAVVICEGRSGDIVEISASILEKGQPKLVKALDKAALALYTHGMLRQPPEDDVTSASKCMNDAKTGIVKSNEGKATAKAEPVATKAGVKLDTAALADLVRDGLTKAQNDEPAIASRGGELRAQVEAEKAISREIDCADQIACVLGRMSYAQLVPLSFSSGADLVKLEVASLVRDRARRQHSGAQARLESWLATAMRPGTESGKDPIGKVEGLIRDVGSRLEKEAGVVAFHKACRGKELVEVRRKETDKGEEIDNSTAETAQMWSARLLGAWSVRLDFGFKEELK